MPTLRLFDWGPSPFCLKVRAILDHKGLEYQRIGTLGPALLELRRRGRIGKVPALEIDGDLVCDSTDIAYQLERRFPEPAILPADPHQRGLCHAIEEWADESLYFVGLYFQWWDPEGVKLAATAFRGPIGRLALPVYRRRIRAQVQGQGTARKPVEHVRRDLDRHLGAVDDLLAGGPFLLGDRPMLCDFAVSAQLVYLSRTPQGGAALAGHPAIAAYQDRMRALRATPVAERQSA